MITLAAFALAAAFQAPVDTPLVSAQWLSQHLRDPNLVLLHVGPRADYDSAHVPGAQFVELSDIAAPRQAGALDLELPDPARLDSVLEARGIADNSRIVLYWSSGWGSPTTRVFLTFTWFGMGPRTSILNGGLNAWRAAGQPVTREIAAAQPATGRLTPHPRSDVVVDATFVRERMRDRSWTIVDARNRVFWTGERPGSGSRNGRVPGAVSVEFVSVNDSSGFYLTPEALRTMFAGAGATPGRPIVAYCHIGQQATQVWFAARLAGYDVRLFDGSWQAWSALPDAPTITGPVTAEERRP